MSALLEAARQAAGGAQDGGPPPAAAGSAVPLVPFAELAGSTSEDPPQVSVFVAWARVMRDVQAVAKDGLYNASGTRYNFRGVDAMINAFGPACRRHGVIVTPHEVHPSHAPGTSSGGKTMRDTTTVVVWRVYGPDGTWFQGASEGESLDSSDKGAAKAQSVALRAFLIAAGMVPTDEPDPDSAHVERGERPRPVPGHYVEEICSAKTSLGRMLQIRREITEHNLGGAIVTNETGDEEKLGDLLARHGKAKQEAAQLGGAE